MIKFEKEYLEFEKTHTEELVKLYTETRDETLRLDILKLRKTLEDLYYRQKKELT